MSRLKKRFPKRFAVLCGLGMLLLVAPLLYAAVVDAPTGYDNLTNGFENQPPFDNDRIQFDTVETIATGLGPVYNAQSCRECHQNPVSGSVAQVNELRAGITDSNGNFTPHSGGSLINDRAIDPSIQEHVFDSDNTRDFRTSLSISGDGFVEAIPDTEFTRIRNGQPAGMKGTIVNVPVLEAILKGTTPTTRIGRFGWKNQHASLLSFAADAYLNEIGITSPLFPNENTSNGNSVAAFDTVGDPEDAATNNHPFGPDVESFTSFMRSTKAPPRGPDNPPTAGDPAQRSPGEIIFDNLGCETCHTDKITTAAPDIVFNGGFFPVGTALGNKIIHPYGDFMLHDIGTGDGIPQGQATGAQIRTAPLWGLRTRTRLMHNGQKLTIKDAINQHGGQAATAASNFGMLSAPDKNALMAFLNSL